jgi:hypothetical protein
MPSKYSPASSTALAAVILAAAPCAAQTTAQLNGKIELLEHQIQQLQQELQTVRGQVQQQAQKPAAPPSAPSAPAQAETKPALGFQNTNVKLSFGGFIEAAGIFRTKSETADVNSVPFASLPFNNYIPAHTSEYRGSARQSRLSLLVNGGLTEDVSGTMYFESDFLGVGTESNSKESNSYVPRLRQAYLTVDEGHYGWHLLAGQAWSFTTLFKEGLTPRREDIPMVIDAQYVPGFTWTRNAQFRLWKDFGKEAAVGVSFESPNANISSSSTELAPPTGPLTAVTGNPGGLLNSISQTYTTNVAPDMIVKAAFDPGWGHYEIFGLARVFETRTNFQNHEVWGGGGGGGVILPIIPGKLEFQLTGLAGPGVGRYSASVMPDVTFDQAGVVQPIMEEQGLAGLVGYIDPSLIVYGYAGGDHAEKTAFNTPNGKIGYGYGSPLFNNTGCDVENVLPSTSSPNPNAANTAGLVNSATCAGNTEDVWQLTAGMWKKLYEGVGGYVNLGLQYSFTRRDSFLGVGGSPYATDNMVFLSLRYYPF